MFLRLDPEAPGNFKETKIVYNDNEEEIFDKCPKNGLLQWWDSEQRMLV